MVEQTAGPVRREVALDALDAAYGQLTEMVSGLGGAELMLPSRCAGWAAGDVLYHQLMDARRALRTFASQCGPHRTGRAGRPAAGLRLAGPAAIPD